MPQSSLHVRSSTTPKYARMVLGGASFKSCTVLMPMARSLAPIRRPTPHTFPTSMRCSSLFRWSSLLFGLAKDQAVQQAVQLDTADQLPAQSPASRPSLRLPSPPSLHCHDRLAKKTASQSYVVMCAFSHLIVCYHSNLYRPTEDIATTKIEKRKNVFFVLF